MGELRKLVFDQQNLIKKLLIGVKKATNTSTTLTEQENYKMTDTQRYVTISKMFRGVGASGSDAGGSSAGQIVDDSNLDVDVDLAREEVVVGSDDGIGKNLEFWLVDKEEDEQLVDYDSEPEYYKTDEQTMTCVTQRGSAEGDVIELDKDDLFMKVEEPEKLTPSFQI